MNRATLPMCGICGEAPATQQLEVLGPNLLLTCNKCAMTINEPIAQTTPSIESVHTLPAKQQLHQLAADLLRSSHTHSSSLTRDTPPLPRGWAHDVALQQPLPHAIARHNSSGMTQLRPTSDPGAASDSQGGTDHTHAGTRLDTLVSTALAIRDADDDRHADAAAGNVGAGRKMCNLCREVQDISRFPVAGERLKPYCSSCMPWVRKGSLMGIRVAELRDALSTGGPEALQSLLHT